jgi:hypothetical protein
MWWLIAWTGYGGAIGLAVFSALKANGIVLVLAVDLAIITFIILAILP